MLLTLTDLKEYTDALAKRVPSIARRVQIHQPGVTADELLRLSALNLPPIYARCISDYSLFGVAVGYFSVWPGSIKAGSMAEALLHANEGDYPGALDARTAGLLVVAEEEANLICVGRSDSGIPDAVYLLDVMRSSNVERQSVASDFEKFLLLAGNLHEIGRKYSDDAKEGLVKMAECCRHFSCTTDQASFWASRAEVVLS